MPPKRAARSSSRSRAVMKTPESARDTSPVKQRSRGRPPKQASEKKPARQASKSSTRRSASKSRAASRSRSSSRSRKVLATPSSAPASTSRKVPKEKKPVVESTHEVADEDDEVEVIRTPRRRTVRNLTQEPPRTRSTAPISPQKTFSDLTAVAPKTQCCAILTAAKTKSLAAYYWLVALLTTVFLFLKRAVLAPFQFVANGWKRVKPADPRLSAALLVLILVAITGVIAYFNPKLVQKAQVLGDRYVATYIRQYRLFCARKHREWSKAISEWAAPKLEALGWNSNTVKIN